MGVRRLDRRHVKAEVTSVRTGIPADEGMIAPPRTVRGGNQYVGAAVIVGVGDLDVPVL